MTNVVTNNTEKEIGTEKCDIFLNKDNRGVLTSNPRERRDQLSNLDKVLRKCGNRDTDQFLRKLCTQLNKSKTKKVNPAPNINMVRNKKMRTMEQDKENTWTDKLTRKSSSEEAENENMETQEEQTTYSVSTTNRYGVLSNITNAGSQKVETNEIEEFVRELASKNKKEPQHTQEDHSREQANKERVYRSPAARKEERSQREKEKENKQPTKKEDRPPPINILYQDPKDTAQLMSLCIGQAKFVIKRINISKHALQVNNIIDFSKAKKALEQAGTCFYTYTPRMEKPRTLLLKGISSEYETQEILNELNSLNVENIKFIKVLQFTTKRSIAEGYKLPIYIVQLDAASQVQQIKKIKQLFHQVIKWENLRRDEITQCKKCQRIGHVASNCNMKYRCVKCNTEHDPGNCKISKNTVLQKTELYCVNCKAFGHPASYKGCPSIVELKKKIEDRKIAIKENKTKRIIQLNSTVRKDISYSQITRNNDIIGENMQKERGSNTNVADTQNRDSNMEKLIHGMFNELKEKFVNQINSLVTRIINIEKKMNYLLNEQDDWNNQND